MMLQRLQLEKLQQWAVSKNRKPLLLQGARQTGKTRLLQRLGETAFKQVCYLNFARQPELIASFDATQDPGKILEMLRLISKVPIVPHETLIIFDDIQLCGSVFGALKYFGEELPEYAVAAAGSLLGVEVRRKSLFVPVGKVDIEHLWPLSFAEFLMNTEPAIYNFIEAIENPATEIPAVIYNRIVKAYRLYQCVGGMPEVVSAFLDGESMEAIDERLNAILMRQRLDFSQYAAPTEARHIAQVWDSIPKQLARENTRFFFSQVAKSAKARKYQSAVQWLTEAKLVLPVNRVSTPRMPLAAYREQEFFKVFLFDVGLLRTMARMPASTILTDDVNFKEFKGALAENFAAASLNRQLGYAPNYWTSGNTAEVDFVVQVDDAICPIEVKAGTNTKGRSLKVFTDKYDSPVSMRLSMLPLKVQENFINVPLPLADWSLKFARKLLAKTKVQSTV